MQLHYFERPLTHLKDHLTTQERPHLKNIYNVFLRDILTSLGETRALKHMRPLCEKAGQSLRSQGSRSVFEKPGLKYLLPKYFFFNSFDHFSNQTKQKHTMLLKKAFSLFWSQQYNFVLEMHDLVEINAFKGSVS